MLNSMDDTQEISEDTTWMLEAHCRGVDPDKFFPTDGAGVEAIQRMCSACPVQTECLEYALFNRIELGVWGGVSARERRRILRRRRQLAGTSELADTSAT
jgi:WhiB family redox-sensing transcriptional regulator